MIAKLIPLWVLFTVIKLKITTNNVGSYIMGNIKSRHNEWSLAAFIYSYSWQMTQCLKFEKFITTQFIQVKRKQYLKSYLLRMPMWQCRNDIRHTQFAVLQCSNALLHVEFKKCILITHLTGRLLSFS